MKQYYLDNAATTKMYPEVLEAMMPYFTDKYGNASSYYQLGRDSKKAIEEARELIASTIHADPNQIYFTSGGTEGDNLAIIGRELKSPGVFITSEIEHSAVLNTGEFITSYLGKKMIRLSCDKDGLIHASSVHDAIERILLDHEKISLVSVMMANNELGTIQPIDRIGLFCKQYNIVFHTDAVQAYGHQKIDVKAMNIDMLSASAHKFHGPKGIGFIYIKNKDLVSPIIFGGSQEYGMRAGTENVPYIVGMAKAAEISYKNLKNKSAVRDYFYKRLREEIKDIKLNGSMKRLDNNLNIYFDGIYGSNLMTLLNEDGVYVSTGSACHQGDPTPSHVLKAIGYSDEEARHCIRITLGDEWNKLDRNVKEEIEKVIQLIKKNTELLRNL